MIHQNKKNISLFLSIIVIFCNIFITSCGSVPKSEKNIELPEPEWILNKKKVFPDSLYIAQLGTGTTATEAKTNSIAELSSYFNTNVKSLVQAQTFTVNNSNDPSVVNREIQSSTVTSTDLDLFALETTEPYFLKRENKWFCCAFIERKTAWNQFVPSVEDDKNQFYSIFNLAQTETEPLNKIKIYNKTQNYSEKFIGSLNKASILSKEMTDKAFAADRALLNTIPGLIIEEKNKCQIYISTTDDFSQIISSSVNNIFTNIGFSVTQNMDKAFYIVEATMNYNIVDEDDLLVYYPSIKVVVGSKDKSLYTYENKLEKILSYNESKAKKTACTQAAQILEKELSSDFEKAMGFDK